MCPGSSCHLTSEGSSAQLSSASLSPRGFLGSSREKTVEKLLSKPGICDQMRKLITKDSIQNAQAGLHQSPLLSARGREGDRQQRHHLIPQIWLAPPLPGSPQGTGASDPFPGLLSRLSPLGDSGKAGRTRVQDPGVGREVGGRNDKGTVREPSSCPESGLWLPW